MNNENDLPPVWISNFFLVDEEQVIKFAWLYYISYIVSGVPSAITKSHNKTDY